MMSKKKHVIGIDIGGTKILVALFDAKFNMIESVKVKTNSNKGEKAFLKVLFGAIDEVMDKAGVKIKDVSAIGAGCPGIIDSKKGIVTTSANIGFLKNYPLAKKLSNQFKVPAVIGNDASIGLYGEQQFGAAKGYNHVVGIAVGTGVGGALILNGELYHGAFGGAGEIGHTLLNPLGAQCGCGKRGCLETEIGRPAIAAEAAVLAIKDRAPKLAKIAGTDVAKIKSGALEEAIERGDKNVETLLRNKSKMLGMAMANIVNLLNPELIVLAGGVVEAMGNIILHESDKAMRNYAMTGLVKDVKVVLAKLGDYAVVKGAAKMAADAR
jgi:glucokinase